jgi:hypothetical protein
MAPSKIVEKYVDIGVAVQLERLAAARRNRRAVCSGDAAVLVFSSVNENASLVTTRKPE